MISKKTYHFFLTTFSIVAIVLFFTFFVFPRAVEWRVKEYFHEKFGAHLYYEEVKWDHGRFLFSKIQIKTKEKEPVKISFTADQLKIDYHLSFWKRNIGLDIQLDAPKFFLVKEQEEINPWEYYFQKIKKDKSEDTFFFFKNKQKKSRFIYTDIQIKVNDGALNFLDPSYQALLSQSFHGVVHFGSSKEVHDHLSLFYGNQETGQFDLTIEYEDREHPFALLNLEGIDCRELAVGFDFLYGPSKLWVVKQGKAFGKFKCDLSNAPYIEGVSSLRDAVIEHVPSSMGMEMQEVELVCSRVSMTSPLEELSFMEKVIHHTKGDLNFVKGASFYRFKEGLPYWMIRSISGGASLNENGFQGFQLGINGQFFFDKENAAKVQITGKLPFVIGATQEERADLAFKISHDREEEVSAQLFVTETLSGSKEVDFFFNHVGPREYETVRNLWPEWSFVWQELEFAKGALSGEIKATLLKGEKLSKISIVNMAAHNLWFVSKGLNIDGYVASLNGNMDFVLSSDEKSLKPKNGSLRLTGGDFYWEKRGVHNDSLERLTDLECTLTLEEGKLQKSSFKGNLGGFKAELQFFGLSSDSVAKINAEGDVDKLLSFLPSEWMTHLRQVSAQDYLSCALELKHYEEGLILEGDFTLRDGSNQISKIDVEAELERIAESSFKNAARKWRRWGISLLERKEDVSLPFQRPKSVHILEVSWLKDALGTWGVVLKQGIVKSERFPFKKYVTPFVFQEDKGVIDGIASFYGDFNDQSLLVHFQIKDLLFENRDFKVFVPEVGHSNLQMTSEKDPASFYYFNFFDESSTLFMPIRRGSYEEKKSHVIFNDLYTQLTFSKKIMQANEIKGVVDNIAFVGSLELDFRPEDLFKVHFVTKDLVADIPAVQAFCKHFDRDKLWDLPIKGRVIAGSEGVVFDASVPHDERRATLRWNVKGTLLEGGYALSPYNTEIEDAKLLFSYNSEERGFNFSNCSGKLLVDKKDLYTFTLPQYKIGLKQVLKSPFDLTIKDEKEVEFIRLLGTINVHEESSLTEIDLDEELSHVGGFYPYVQSLVLKEFTTIEKFKASPELHLQTLFTDLEKLSSANIFPVSQEHIHYWASLPLDGEIQGDFSIDDTGFLFTFEGNSVEYNKKPVECSLKAYGFQDIWSIEKLQLGTFALNAELQKEQEGVLIKEIHASDAGVTLLANGFFSTKEKSLSLHIDNLAVSLQELKVTRNWKMLANLWKPEGKISFNGDLKAVFKNALLKPIVDFSGKAFLENIKLRNNHIQNQSNIPVSFSTERGLQVDGLEISIRQSDQYQYKAIFNLNKVHYNFEEDALHLHHLGFSLSSNYLRELAHLGREFFPDLFDEQVYVFLRDIKREGGLQGFMNIDLLPGQVLVGLQLQDGVYTLFGKEYHLKNVLIRATPSQISVQADYQIEEVPLRIILQADHPGVNRGVAYISDAREGQIPPLKILWRMNPNSDLVLQKVEGSLVGVALNLQENHDLSLTGQIKLLNSAKLAQILPKELRDTLLEWKIGSGYTFTGQIILPKEQIGDFQLQGVIEGKDVQFDGIELDYLKSNFFYSRKEVLFNQLIVADKGGGITIPSLLFKVDANHFWHLSMPLLRIQEFKPHAFSKDKQKTKPIKNLVIHEAELKNLQGILGIPASFQATGYFRFEKIVKNTLSNILLAIPSEILGTIGLNTSIMSPAMGTVQFFIKDRRIYITNLQDVYSEGKKSRFYLPKGPIQSYVDFDGNLNLYIRMKQYNILLKLAESLRFHVTGQWDSPKVSVEKTLSQ